MTKNRRRSLFVPHSVQWDYLRLVLIAMIAPTFVATACLYYLIWQTVAQEMAIPELIAQVLFPALKQVNQVVVIGLPITFALIFFFAVKLSHRLIGPIYRLERDLETMAETGDVHRFLRIRPHDHLHSLVAKINRVLRKAREHREH
jgi:signal transduction histidine kinase